MHKICKHVQIKKPVKDKETRHNKKYKKLTNKWL